MTDVRQLKESQRDGQADYAVLQNLRSSRNECLRNLQLENALIYGSLVYSCSKTPTDGLVLGYIFNAQHEYDAVIELMKIWYQDCIKCRILLLDAMMQKKQYDMVLYYSDVDLDSSHLWKIRGEAFLMKKSVKMAVECFCKCLKLDLFATDAFEMIVGQFLMSPKDILKFLNELFFEMEGEEMDFLYQYYKMQIKSKERTESFQNQNIVVQTQQADEAMMLGNFILCEKILSEVLAVSAYYKPALSLYLMCLSELNDELTLFKVSSSLGELNNYDCAAMIPYSKGCYHLTKNNTMAQKYFREAILLDNKFSLAKIGFGKASVFDKEIDTAISELILVTKTIPYSHEMYLSIARCARNNKRMFIALSYYREAFDRCPDDAAVCGELGLTLLALDSIDEAFEYLKKAENLLNSTSKLRSNVHYGLANIYERKKEQNSSLLQIEKSLRHCTIPQEKPSKLVFYGNLLLSIGRREEAIDAFHKALRYKPGDPIALSVLLKAVSSVQKRQTVKPKIVEEDNLVNPFLGESTNSNWLNRLRSQKRIS